MSNCYNLVYDMDYMKNFIINEIDDIETEELEEIKNISKMLINVLDEEIRNRRGVTEQTEDLLSDIL